MNKNFVLTIERKTRIETNKGNQMKASLFPTNERRDEMPSSGGLSFGFDSNIIFNQRFGVDKAPIHDTIMRIPQTQYLNLSKGAGETPYFVVFFGKELRMDMTPT